MMLLSRSCTSWESLPRDGVVVAATRRIKLRGPCLRETASGLCRLLTFRDSL